VAIGNFTIGRATGLPIGMVFHEFPKLNSLSESFPGICAMGFQIEKPVVLYAPMAKLGVFCDSSVYTSMSKTVDWARNSLVKKTLNTQRM
jgi:hypothetical protein